MEEESTIDLKDFFDVIKKRIWLIVIVTLGCTVISAVVSFWVIKPTYEAGVSVVIGKTGNDFNDKSQFSYNDVIMYQNLVKTYNAIAKTKLVAEKASLKLKGEFEPQFIQKTLKVTPEANTQILKLKVESKNPKDAFKLINAVTEAFMNEGKRVFPTGDIKVLDKAEVPAKPVKPNKKVNIAVAFFLGLMVSVGISFLLEYLDNTIKTEEEVEKYLKLPVIGTIPKIQE